MSITIKMNQDNTGIQMSGTTAGRNKTQDTKTRSTVFAGDLMLGQGNQIEQKKQTARRQAMKLITDAWGRDELASQSIKDMELMRYIDVLVDGEFECDKKDANLHWKGSSNQRVIDVQETLRRKEIVLYEF